MDLFQFNFRKLEFAAGSLLVRWGDVSPKAVGRDSCHCHCHPSVTAPGAGDGASEPSASQQHSQLHKFCCKEQ